MTMFKTKEEIKILSKNYYASVNMDKDCQDGYFQGYTQAQQDIKEACSKGFDECFSKYATESNLHHEFDAHYFWQAAKLDSMKELQEKDEEIAHLKSANGRLEEARMFHLQESEKFQDKYQESVNDIDTLSKYHINYGSLEINEIRTKYGLNKEES